MHACRYEFRSMTAQDLPTVCRWLQAPHVSQWWGDPDQQFALVSGDLSDPAMEQFVVSTEDRPFAYLQCYDPMAWPENGFGALPIGSRGIDQFIGETHMIGRSHGSAMIRSFVDALFETSTPRVITDPDPTNARAVKAYEKAGFLKSRPVNTPDRRALLMVRDL
jgi:aminoglycoside 6'-N-acetyltransferase